MPELPEVETTRRGIAPFLERRSIERLVVRESRLRWPVDLPESLAGCRVQSVGRRAKYIIIETTVGALIIHLGMSGSLRIVSPDEPHKVHDHIDIHIKGGTLIRYNDPRRFGSFHFTADPVLNHWLLANLGVEPLGNAFSGEHLFRCSRKRRSSVKAFIMDGRIVVGVGNIYAAEALFLARIRPTTAAHRVSRFAYAELAQAIRGVLGNAIQVGGTTLRDFVNSDGQPGYFKQSLNVYGRAGERCKRCDGVLRGQVLAQRSTVFCPKCQLTGGWERSYLG